MKRTFEYKGNSYKVRKERGVRLSHEQTDDLLRTLLGKKAVVTMSGDTLIVVSDGMAYITTIRESVCLEDE